MTVGTPAQPERTDSYYWKSPRFPFFYQSRLNTDGTRKVYYNDKGERYGIKGGRVIMAILAVLIIGFLIWYFGFLQGLASSHDDEHAEARAAASAQANEAPPSVPPTTHAASPAPSVSTVYVTPTPTAPSPTPTPTPTPTVTTIPPSPPPAAFTMDQPRWDEACNQQHPGYRVARPQSVDMSEPVAYRTKCYNGAGNLDPKAQSLADAGVSMDSYCAQFGMHAVVPPNLWADNSANQWGCSP